MNNSFIECNFMDYKFPLPQYLGAKYRFRSWIQEFIPKDVRTAVDAFGGSQSIAYFFKQLGMSVYTNDLMAYSNAIGVGLVENKDERLTESDLGLLMLSNPDPSYYDLMQREFTDVFFREEDTSFIDAFRGNVDRLTSNVKKSLALAVMNRALTRKVTMGHFAHLRALAYADDPIRVKRNRSLARPIKEIFLELVPAYNSAVFDNNMRCESHQGDAAEYISGLKNVDLAYFDPPYGNSHADYQQFYHLLETYTEYWKDKKFVNGVHRYEPRRNTPYDKKTTIIQALETLFTAAQDIPYWIMSYNDRSYPDEFSLVALVQKHRDVRVVRKPYAESRGGKGSVAGSSEILIIGERK